MTEIHHLDVRKQCFSAEKRTKITRKSPIFAQSEKVKIQQKILDITSQRLDHQYIYLPATLCQNLKKIDPVGAEISKFLCLTEKSDILKFRVGWYLNVSATLSDRPSAALCPCRVPRNPWKLLRPSELPADTSESFPATRKASRDLPQSRYLPTTLDSQGLHHELHKLVSWFQFDIWIATVFKSKYQHRLQEWLSTPHTSTLEWTLNHFNLIKLRNIWYQVKLTYFGNYLDIWSTSDIPY